MYIRVYLLFSVSGDWVGGLKNSSLIPVKTIVIKNSGWFIYSSNYVTKNEIRIWNSAQSKKKEVHC